MFFLKSGLSKYLAHCLAQPPPPYERFHLSQPMTKAELVKLSSPASKKSRSLLPAERVTKIGSSSLIAMLKQSVPASVTCGILLVSFHVEEHFDFQRAGSLPPPSFLEEHGRHVPLHVFKWRHQSPIPEERPKCNQLQHATAAFQQPFPRSEIHL